MRDADPIEKAALAEVARRHSRPVCNPDAPEFQALRADLDEALALLREAEQDPYMPSGFKSRARALLAKHTPTRDDR